MALIISTKGRYGLRAMFELAKAWGQGPLSLKQISAAQGLPEPYLEQIFPALKKAGLVEARRGVGGGYELARLPEKISVGSVLVALEGELTPAECAGGDMACENADCCTTHAIWQRIYDGINGVIHGISLADMVEDDRRMGASKQTEKRC
jgi:Rrf2 family cysteine metabolism transcriptional repressor